MGEKICPVGACASEIRRLRHGVATCTSRRLVPARVAPVMSTPNGEVHVTPQSWPLTTTRAMSHTDSSSSRSDAEPVCGWSRSKSWR
jgi:hypothetical protein